MGHNERVAKVICRTVSIYIRKWRYPILAPLTENIKGIDKMVEWHQENKQ